MSNPLNEDSGAKENVNPAGLLAWWLDVATKDLAIGAQARIRSEIESHYAESVHSHLGEGMSEPDSQAAAFAELGEPTIAAKHFRKHHLTEREESKLQKLEKNAAKLSIPYEWVLICGVWLMISRTPFINAVIHRWGPTCALGGFISWFSPRLLFSLLPARSRIQGLLSFQILTGVIFFVVFIFIAVSYGEMTNAALPLSVIVSYTFPQARLWLKLRKVKHASGEISSSDTSPC
jgi:hypothetical protein